MTIRRFSLKDHLEQIAADKEVFSDNPDLQRFARRPYPSELVDVEAEVLLAIGEELVATLVTRTDDPEVMLTEFLIGPVRRGRRGRRGRR